MSYCSIVLMSYLNANDSHAPFLGYLSFCLSWCLSIRSLLILSYYLLLDHLHCGCLLFPRLFLKNPFPCLGDTLDCALPDRGLTRLRIPLLDYPHQLIKVLAFQGLLAVSENNGFGGLTALA